MESDIGRAVKLGIQRMKIRSIGSDPRKHTNDKIKSKLLADDSAPPMMMAPAPPVALGLGDAQGVGGFNFNAFAAAVQSNTASRGPPQPAPPPAGFAGNGFNPLSQLMSAMGGNANLGAMPALPAHAMREEDAFLSSNGSAPQPSLPDAVAQREPEPPLPQQAPPPILPFTSLYSVKVENSESYSYYDSEESESEEEEEEEDRRVAPGKAANGSQPVPVILRKPDPPTPAPAPVATPAPVVRPGLSPNLTFVAIALGETRGMLEKLQSACADLTLEEQRILMAGCSMIKKVAGAVSDRKGAASLGLPDDL